MNPKSVSQTQINEQWYLVDAKGMRIGIVASKVAQLLLGKMNPLSRDYLDPKVKVVVINAAHLDITAKRSVTKFYKNYSGFPGGLRFTELSEVLKKDPTFPLFNAIKGMLPKTKKGNALITNVRIFEGTDHLHEAQKPEKVDFTKIKL